MGCFAASVGRRLQIAAPWAGPRAHGGFDAIALALPIPDLDRFMTEMPASKSIRAGVVGTGTIGRNQGENPISTRSTHHDCPRPANTRLPVKTPHFIPAILQTTAALSSFLLAGMARGDSVIYTNDFQGPIGVE